MCFITWLGTFNCEGYASLVITIIAPRSQFPHQPHSLKHEVSASSPLYGCCFCYFWVRVSWCSLCWAETLSDLVALIFIELYLPLPPNCRDWWCVPLCPMRCTRLSPCGGAELRPDDPTTMSHACVRHLTYHHMDTLPSHLLTRERRSTDQGVLRDTPKCTKYTVIMVL